MTKIVKTDKGYGWSLRWTVDGDTHLVTAKAGENTEIVYRGANRTDADDAFHAEQGKRQPDSDHSVLFGR